jgi:hypothetical protein
LPSLFGSAIGIALPKNDLKLVSSLTSHGLLLTMATNVTSDVAAIHSDPGRFLVDHERKQVIRHLLTATCVPRISDLFPSYHDQCSQLDS